MARDATAPGRDFKVVIPARFASTRLPGKPLADIAGKPMVVHVAERALQSGASEVWVAADHDAVVQAVRAHGMNACMTSPEHASGTDRIAEVARQRGWDANEIIVNVQGDEPLIDPALIGAVAQRLRDHPAAAISTACHALRERGEMFNPNVVKVVLDRDGFALYFSRAAIPYAREAFAAGDFPAALPAYRHIGIYAYRADFLAIYGGLAMAEIEHFEALEQLRAMWHGYRISVAISVGAPMPGVDTAEDLQKVRELSANSVR